MNDIQKYYNIREEKGKTPYYEVILTVDIKDGDYVSSVTRFNIEDFENYVGFYIYLIKKYASETGDLQRITYNDRDSSILQGVMRNMQILKMFNPPHNSFREVGFTLRNFEITKVVEGKKYEVLSKLIKESNEKEDINKLLKLNSIDDEEVGCISEYLDELLDVEGVVDTSGNKPCYTFKTQSGVEIGLYMWEDLDGDTYVSDLTNGGYYELDNFDSKIQKIISGE